MMSKRGRERGRGVEEFTSSGMAMTSTMDMFLVSQYSMISEIVRLFVPNLLLSPGEV